MAPRAKSIEKDDLGWPFRENGEARVYITCFVLRTLSALDVQDDEYIEAAIHWLINIQNKMVVGVKFLEMSQVFSLLLMLY